MSVPADKTYPATATNAAWQKKKSFLDKAKAKTKTGLGATLLDAEKSWKAIPWADLDASTKTAGTPESAERLRDKAKEALKKVTKARDDLRAAKEQAKDTKIIKGLSKTASDAAANIERDLNQAINRLGQVKLDDFDDLVKRLEAQSVLNMTKVSVYGKDGLVMKANAATWDRKVLKVTAPIWQGGATAKTVAGQKLKVHGELVGNRDAEGISKLFVNDMKIDSASGNTASFKSY